MKIHDDHMYHGAALIQIAEHKRFTAINSLKVAKKTYRNAYRINDKIVIYLKYASKKNKAHDEYIFTFSKQHLKDLKTISKAYPKTFISLVCVGDREICCLSYSELKSLIEARQSKKGSKEEQYTVLVTIPAKKSMRVYLNHPRVKNTLIGEEKLIKRNEFPRKIFG